jgi:hypothetical protein
VQSLKECIYLKVDSIKMDELKILDLFLYSIPALITGIIAFYFFREHTKNEEGRRRYLLHKDIQVNSLPLRLQAYERMTLFLERITPAKLLTRVSPTSSNKNSYEALLIANIEQEYEHNLSQQIYISDECWSVICASKNATIQLIRKASLLEKTSTAQKLQEIILAEMIEKHAPSDTALSYIKKEVSELWS